MLGEPRRTTARCGLIVVVCAALASSGCVVTASLLIPDKKKVETFEVVQEVEVVSVPGGARVTGEDGQTHETPTRIGVRHKVKRVGFLERWWWTVVVTGVAYAGYSYALIRDVTESPDRYTLLLLYAMLVDTYSSVYTVRRGATHNRTWRAHARLVPIPRETTMRATWDDHVSVEAPVTVPQQRWLSMRRPTLGTFDEALIHWAETAEQTPPPVGLRNLGEAYYQRWRRTGEQSHRDQAARYYRAFLETGAATSQDQRRARERLRELEGRR